MPHLSSRMRLLPTPDQYQSRKQMIRGTQLIQLKTLRF